VNRKSVKHSGPRPGGGVICQYFSVSCILATILATDGGAVFQPPIIHLEVVEPIFLPGAFGGWETAAPFGYGSAAVR
jgi:hypothetical protein